MFSFKKIYKNKIWIYICLFLALLSIGYLINQKETTIKSIKFLEDSLEKLPYHITGGRAMAKDISDEKLKKEFDLYTEKATKLYFDLELLYGEILSKVDDNYYESMDKVFSSYEELKVMEKSFQGKLDDRFFHTYFSDKNNPIYNFMMVYKYHRDHNIHIKPTRETFLGLYESTWSLIFSPVFILIMLIIAILSTEMNHQEFKVDEASYKYPKESLIEFLWIALIPAITVLSFSLGTLALSIIRGNPLGSLREILSIPVLRGSFFSTDSPDSNFGLYHGSYFMVFLQLLLLSTLTFLLMYLLYRLFRRHLNFTWASSLITLIALSIIFLEKKLINLELYFTFNTLRILNRPINLILLITLCLFLFYLNFLFRHKREPKFNSSREFTSEKVDSLMALEWVKLKRSYLLRLMGIVLVGLCILITFSFNTNPNSIREESIQTLDNLIMAQENVRDKYIDIEQENMLNNPEKTLELLENLKQSYLDKEKDPKTYLKNYLKYNIQGDVIGIDDTNMETYQNYNIDRIRYFLTHNIKPDESLSATGDSNNLYSYSEPISLYLNNLREGTFEAKGLIGEFIKANSLGFFTLLVVLIPFVLSIKICDDLGKGNPALLFASGKSKREIYLTKLIKSLVLTIGIILLSYLILGAMGVIKGGTGEVLYPVINYKPIPDANSYSGVNVSALSILPKVILISLLFSITVTTFIFMLSSSGYKNSHILGVVLTIVGIYIANKGFLGEFALLNPFTYFEPMLVANGGMNFVNNASKINFYTGTIVMLVESIIFFIVGISVFNRRKL